MQQRCRQWSGESRPRRPETYACGRMCARERQPSHGWRAGAATLERTRARPVAQPSTVKEESGSSWGRAGSWLKGEPRPGPQAAGRAEVEEPECPHGVKESRRAFIDAAAADRSQHRAREFSCDGPTSWFRGASVWCTFGQRSRRARTGAHSCNGGREHRCLDRFGNPNVLDSVGDRVDALGKLGKLARGCAERVKIGGARHEDTSKTPQRKGATKARVMTTEDCKVERAASQHDHKVGGAERPSPAAQTTQVCKSKCPTNRGPLKKSVCNVGSRYVNTKKHAESPSRCRIRNASRDLRLESPLRREQKHAFLTRTRLHCGRNWRKRTGLG